MRAIDSRIFFILLTFTSSFSFSQISEAEINHRIKSYLDKENVLNDFCGIKDSCLCLYPSPEAKAKDSAEYKFPLGTFTKTSASFSQFKPTVEKPLNGMRIAIDPGHIAGDEKTARMEKKYVAIGTPSKTRTPRQVSLIEGNLTLATALLLKKDLEKAGAIVMLTREKPNVSSFGITFDEWLKTKFAAALDSAYKNEDITFEEKTFLETKATQTEIFRRFFTLEDIRERARKINAFNPDISIIIHYNVDDTNEGWTKTSDKNFVMTFVPGAFMKEELEKKRDRMEFMRLALCSDIENSITLSSILVKTFSEKLNVPLAKTENAKYLSEYCMETTKGGVFCRNLSLTRLVHGTLVYGETLFQDNKNEFSFLTKNEITVDGMKTSKRVKDVADAYFEGILKFADTVK